MIRLPHGTSYKPREPRQKVHLRARMRSNSGWSDIVIGNSSSRGLMLRCTKAPAKGTYIEVRRSDMCVVGRVVWSDGHRCGVRTQDHVQNASSLQCISAKSGDWYTERRATSGRNTFAIEERAGASRRMAKVFDWLAIALCGAVFATLAANTVHSLLESSLNPVRTHLAGPR